MEIIKAIKNLKLKVTKKNTKHIFVFKILTKNHFYHNCFLYFIYFEQNLVFPNMAEHLLSNFKNALKLNQIVILPRPLPSAPTFCPDLLPRPSAPTFCPDLLARWLVWLRAIE